jgi:hypothetical protein
MTRCDLRPDLERLGEALRASATIDLAREEQAAHPSEARQGLHPVALFATWARRTRPRSRVFASGTLGLAGVGAALVLILSAGGATAPPAFAITKHDDGSLTVNLSNPNAGLIGTNRKLAAMGTGEHINFTMAQGPAAHSGAVDCVPSPQNATVSGPAVKVTVGPGDSNTATIPSGNTGAGTWHVAACTRSNGADPTGLRYLG